ncbi:MAG: hypothetical protein AAGI30_12970 [Planctomycetota bacterium]
MPFVGSIISARQASPPPPATKSRKEKAEESRDPRRLAEVRDEAELSVQQVEQTGTERPIAENTSEDSAEDREAQVYYGPGSNERGAEPPRLDLEG